MEVNGQLHAPATIFPVKSPEYPVTRRLSSLQDWLEYCGEKKNLLPPSGIEIRLLGHACMRLVTVSTELSELVCFMKLLTKYEAARLFEKWLLGVSGKRWIDNIKVITEKIVYDGDNNIVPAEDSFKWY